MINTTYKSSSINIRLPKNKIECSKPINIPVRSQSNKKQTDTKHGQEIDYDLNGQINDPFTNSPMILKIPQESFVFTSFQFFGFLSFFILNDVFIVNIFFSLVLLM
mgnify:CR=1 FL=1